MTGPFAVAANFHCKGSWTDRLRLAEGEGWRAPNDDELAGLTGVPPEDGGACSYLFSIPMYMRHRFWAMLDEEAAEGTGDFVGFSDDLAAFLAFKGLPPPTDAVCELLLQDTGGKVATDDVWALANFGDDPVLLAWPGLQLRLHPGEALKIAAGHPPDVVAPQDDDVNVLLAIRLAAA